MTHDVSLSFLVWSLLMLGVLLYAIVLARRARVIDSRLEKTASEVLPELGRIAARRHKKRFGTSSDIEKTNWYPKEKHGPFHMARKHV